MKNDCSFQIESVPGFLLEQEIAEYYRLKAGAEDYRKARPRLDGLLSMLAKCSSITIQITVDPKISDEEAIA